MGRGGEWVWGWGGVGGEVRGAVSLCSSSSTCNDMDRIPTLLYCIIQRYEGGGCGGVKGEGSRGQGVGGGARGGGEYGLCVQALQ